MFRIRLLSLTAAAVLLLGAATLALPDRGAWLGFGAAMADSHVAAEDEVPAETEEMAEEDGGVLLEMVQGSPDAPVTIIEYASFTCPHCADFHAETYPEFRAQYIDTGLVQFIYREVYFDRYGLWAGMVARCAGPMRYFGLVDLIYENQREWVSNDPAETAENLRRLGRQAGLTNEALDACLSDAETAEALYASYQANMEEHPITGTPTLVIDGELYSGNRSLESLAELIDPLLPEDTQ